MGALDDIPFSPFAAIGKPLSECRVGRGDEQRDGAPGLGHCARRSKAARVLTAHQHPRGRAHSRKSAYDRYATTLDDVDSYLPLTHLRHFVAEDESRRGASLPDDLSEYSQRKTLGVDAPEILKQMREDRVDVAVLTAV